MPGASTSVSSVNTPCATKRSHHAASSPSIEPGRRLDPFLLRSLARRGVHRAAIDLLRPRRTDIERQRRVDPRSHVRFGRRARRLRKHIGLELDAFLDVEHVLAHAPAEQARLAREAPRVGRRDTQEIRQALRAGARDVRQGEKSGTAQELDRRRPVRVHVAQESHRIHGNPRHRSVPFGSARR
jgi:hypothetical protein